MNAPTDYDPDDDPLLYDRERHREFLEMLDEHCSDGGFLFGDQFDGVDPGVNRPLRGDEKR